MNLLLLLPLGLAALAALVLPVLLHLARRSEPRTTVFAALRWLRPQPQPQRRHRLEELLLLLVRLLLLALLALLLAQPVLFGRPDLHPYVAIADGVDASAARAALTNADARWHRLAPGFPTLDEDDASQGTANAGPSHATLPSLLRELDATLPAGVPLTVVVPPVLVDADAQRPVLSRRVDWRVVPGATRLQADGVAADAAANALPGETAPADRKPSDDTLTTFALAVRYAPDRAAALPYLRAAGIAWATPPGGGASGRRASRTSDAPAATPIDPRTRHLAWLVPGVVPQFIRTWIADGGRVLLDAQADWPGLDDAPVLWRDDEGALVRGFASGRGRVMRLERPLLPASMPALLAPDFPNRLRDLFADAQPAPARVAAADYAPSAGTAPWREQPRPLAPWLAWAVAIAFLLERWLANGRRRSDAP